MFGGSTTSILLNTPGESAAVVTAIDGNPMARKGRGAQALAAATIGHFVGGIIGTIALVLLAPTVAKHAVEIGAPDFFAIMVLAFIAVTSALGASRVRGFASLLIGLTIGLVGLDEMAHVRLAASLGRHRRGDRGAGAVRARRVAVGRRASPPHGRQAHPGRTAVARQGGPQAGLDAVAARQPSSRERPGTWATATSTARESARMPT
jgi:hypothetical protein